MSITRRRRHGSHRWRPRPVHRVATRPRRGAGSAVAPWSSRPGPRPSPWPGRWPCGPFVDAAAAAAGEVDGRLRPRLRPGRQSGGRAVSRAGHRQPLRRPAAFATEKGLVPPSYAPSGLLCSINLIPASGCGQSVAGGYIYWSYFTGSGGGWAYSSTGAFATVTTRGRRRVAVPGPGKRPAQRPGTPHRCRSSTRSARAGAPRDHHHHHDDVDDGAPGDRRWVGGAPARQTSAPVQTPAATVAPKPAAGGGRAPATTAPRTPRTSTTTTTVSTGSTVTSTTVPRLHRTDGPAGGPRHRPGSLGRAGHRVRPADHRRPADRWLWPLPPAPVGGSARAPCEARSR